MWGIFTEKLLLALCKYTWLKQGSKKQFICNCSSKWACCSVLCLDNVKRMPSISQRYNLHDQADLDCS